MRFNPYDANIIERTKKDYYPKHLLLEIDNLLSDFENNDILIEKSKLNNEISDENQVNEITLENNDEQNNPISTEELINNVSIEDDILLQSQEDIQINLEKYNISVKYEFGKYFIIINNSKLELTSFDELYEFHNFICTYLKTKESVRKKKKKIKKKYNDSLEIFLNKYDYLRKELENILKFNIIEFNTTENKTNVDYEFINSLKENNIKLCEEELNRNYDNFYKIFDNCEISILEKSFLEVRNNNYQYIKYLEDCQIEKVNKKYIDIYKDIKMKFNQKKFIQLVNIFKKYKIMFSEKSFRDSLKDFLSSNLTTINNFKSKKCKIYKVTNSNRINRLQICYFKDINYYSKTFETLATFYENNPDLKTKENEILINKCHKMYNYFNNSNLIRKNDYINYTFFRLEDAFPNIPDLNIDKLSEDYIEYIFDLPDSFFILNQKNIIKLTKDYVNLFRKKHNITLQQHLNYFQNVPKFIVDELNTLN